MATSRRARGRSAYLDFVASRETDEVQLFYVPTYACNFGCSYCFQDEYAPPPATEVSTPSLLTAAAILARATGAAAKRGVATAPRSVR